MNYAADQSYSAGGFHVAAIAQETQVDEARSGTRNGLSSSHDTIRWTNVMAVINQELLFAIKNGYCSDWGAFGGPEYLVKMSAGSITDLNSYHPRSSLSDVDIGYGANRVAEIELKSVRVFYVDGNVIEVPVNQVVEQ